ncbi:polyketide cyclase [Marmoricola endophyticus]|uniref:Polyketide cyclase n=1 Tax=Marmoricola endophyticus TaxID=2040280 RepID=A0A917BNC6_9ACTN|nr:SRPBCC family protein [Marmoricola endophyticus]GGF49805.1 polyketide cyclase [Marmoricola endophyticus]
MNHCERVVGVRPGQVWDVLCDGWLYPLFVVGASRMRSVDRTWPAPGARLHHSVGAWPLLVDDVTEVLEAEPGRRLRLRAHGWPLGAAEVVLDLAGEHHAGQEVTRVRISEDVTSGPGLLVPRPVRSPQIRWRNAETLRRLALVCEGRAATGS